MTIKIILLIIALFSFTELSFGIEQKSLAISFQDGARSAYYAVISSPSLLYKGNS